jgi:hypothetical protein
MMTNRIRRDSGVNRQITSERKLEKNCNKIANNLSNLNQVNESERDNLVESGAVDRLGRSFPVKQVLPMF